MRKSVRFGLAIMVAAVALSAMLASAASANHLSVSNQGFRVVWRSLIFGVDANNTTVLCPVTLEGSFHSATIAKTVGSLIGYITRASVGAPASCIGGEATVLTATLPWHVTYQGFTGELPRFEGVKLSLLGTAFQVHQTGGLTCLARSEARNPANGIVNVEAGGKVTALTPEPTPRLPLTGEAGFCTLTHGFFKSEEVGTVTVLGTTTAISVTLI